MVSWECPTKPREASGLDPEAVHVQDDLKRDLEPLIHGGGQEHGLRSGTENVPGIVRMGVAAERAESDREERAKRLSELRAEFIQQVRDRTAGRLIGHPEKRLPGYALFCFEGYNGAQLIQELANEGIAVSSGSACHSATPSPSRVLTEMGVGVEEALGAVRFSMGRHTTHEDILHTVDVLNDIL